jgi:hypothetical protein
MIETPTAQSLPKRRFSPAVGLALLALVLGALLALLLINGGSLADRGQTAEKLAVRRITLPRPGMILVDVVNAGSTPVTIAQVQVDGAFWEFALAPSGTLPRFGRATLSIPYPWVQGEPHRIVLITSSGATFVGALALE